MWNIKKQQVNCCEICFKRNRTEEFKVLLFHDCKPSGKIINPRVILYLFFPSSPIKYMTSVPTCISELFPGPPHPFPSPTALVEVLTVSHLDGCTTNSHWMSTLYTILCQVLTQSLKGTDGCCFHGLMFLQGKLKVNNHCLMDARWLMQQRLSIGAGERAKVTSGRLSWETNKWAELWRMGKNGAGAEGSSRRGAEHFRWFLAWTAGEAKDACSKERGRKRHGWWRRQN